MERCTAFSLIGNLKGAWDTTSPINAKAIQRTVQGNVGQDFGELG